MKITVHAVGRMKSGPEKELAERFFGRFAKSGPQVGLEFAGIVETPESHARSAEERRREESARITAKTEGAVFLLLDERGRNISSRQFADDIARLRDSGGRDLVIAIGGPDGHGEEARRAAEGLISFGVQTWPHQLVRVMLAEQLYRAATILSGHPYHRD